MIFCLCFLGNIYAQTSKVDQILTPVIQKLNNSSGYELFFNIKEENVVNKKASYKKWLYMLNLIK